MLTQYDPWTQGDLASALRQANMDRNATYLTNAAFLTHCIDLETAEGIEPNTIYVYAGDQLGAHPGPYTYVTTPEQCLEVYRHFNPKPADPKREKTEAALARSRERDAKQAAHVEYVEAYNAYTVACRERKERIEAARVRCNEAIAEANAEYSRNVVRAAMQRDEATREVRAWRDQVMSEPVPTAPVKRQ